MGRGSARTPRRRHLGHRAADPLSQAALDADGRITALDWDQRDDVGAYLRAPEPATFYRMHGALSGAYDIPHIAVRNRVVVTNKTPTGLVRGLAARRCITRSSG